MSAAISLMHRFCQERDGITAIEYAIIAGVVCASLGASFLVLTVHLNTYVAALTL